MSGKPSNPNLPPDLLETVSEAVSDWAGEHGEAGGRPFWDAATGLVLTVLAEHALIVPLAGPDGSKAAPQPDGTYCRVQIKGYQEYTGWLTEGTFCGIPYGFLRDREGREIAKFPPDSVHLITPPEPEMPGPWERPALPAADGYEEEGPF